VPARLALAVTAAIVALGVASPAGSTDGHGFFVGFTEDLIKSAGSSAVRPATDLGASAFRVTLMWEPGQTQPSSSQVDDLNRATGATGGLRLALAVYADAGSKAPLDGRGRDAYCAYVRNVLTRYPSIRDVVIWNEAGKRLFWNPQTGAPALYEALLARCYDVLHAAVPDVNVIGLALSSTGNDDSGSTSPGAFIRALGDAYRASGRARPILDTVGFHPYPLTPGERPWRRHVQSKTIGEGDWNKLVYNLWLAFNGTAQPTPGSGGVSIWYLEAGFQTTIDAAKQALYGGTENVAVIPDSAGGEPDAPPPAETSRAPDQATQIVDAVRLAACQPDVGAYFNFLLADEPALGGWQSGAYWADLSPKDSAGAFRTAFGEAGTGSVACDSLKGGSPSADFMPPTAPTGLQAQSVVSPLSIVLAWSPATDDASSISYRVYRNGAFVAVTTDTAWTDANVFSGTSYTYAVRAIDSASNLGDASSPLSVAAADVTPPASPASLSAQPMSYPLRVQLSWPAALDNVGVTAYVVSRDGVPLATVGDTGFTDSTVAGTTSYAYSVVAVDAAGNQSAPAVASVLTPEATPADTTPPSTPTGLRVATSRNPIAVQLVWAASSDDVGVAGYRVYRNGSPLATTGSTDYLDSTAKASTTYRYAVSAVDLAGNEGVASATVRVKTPRR
jgi:fibronectin type 3 domain-containing protein